MPLTPLAPTDTRGLFRPVSAALVTRLRELAPGDWNRPTVAGTWEVRDVLAHLTDVTLRRLSFHRDGMAPPQPDGPIRSDREFVDFINGLNAQWIRASKRLSPRVLTDLFEGAAAALADWFEALPLDAPALFAVSWAGERESKGWFDVGREFVELWHHQQQIRIAVGAPSLDDPRYLHAVLEISLRALPHAYRDTAAGVGETVVLDVSGPSGGVWTLVRGSDRWMLQQGEPPVASARVAVTDELAWKIMCNALSEEDATAAVDLDGPLHLAAPLIRARAVIV